MYIFLCVSVCCLLSIYIIMFSLSLSISQSICSISHSIYLPNCSISHSIYLYLPNCLTVFLSLSLPLLSSDGVGRTGTFICLHSQLERLKTEGVADVLQAVKSARIQRAGVVRNAVCLLYFHSHFFSLCVSSLHPSLIHL